MFIRCAYLIGKPAQGRGEALQQALQSLLKMYMSFEKIRSVKLLTGKEWEKGAPGIYAALELCFDSEADLKAALATPFRQEFRAYFAANVTPLFEGIVRHVNYDVLEQTP